MSATPLLFSLIPMALAVFGGTLGLLLTLKPRYVDALQSFVSGVLISVVATELVPKILNSKSDLGSAWPIGLGFIIGAAIMFGLHEFSHYLAHFQSKKRIPLGLIGGSVIDLFVDGMLISLAFLAGSATSFVLAMSLAPCAFLLSLSAAKALKKVINPHYSALFLGLIALMLPLGACFGWLFTMKISTLFLHELLAASIAALLYIGVEELLLEHRRESRSLLSSIVFFVGFFGVLWFQI